MSCIQTLGIFVYKASRKLNKRLSLLMIWKFGNSLEISLRLNPGPVLLRKPILVMRGSFSSPTYVAYFVPKQSCLMNSLHHSYQGSI